MHVKLLHKEHSDDKADSFLVYIAVFYSGVFIGCRRWRNDAFNHSYGLALTDMVENQFTLPEIVD